MSTTHKPGSEEWVAERFQRVVVRKVRKATRWPKTLIPFKLLAREGDTGLGDVVTRVIGLIGGVAFETWYKKVFKKPCGCENRKTWLNKKFPL